MLTKADRIYRIPEGLKHMASPKDISTFFTTKDTSHRRKR